VGVERKMERCGKTRETANMEYVVWQLWRQLRTNDIHDICGGATSREQGISTVDSAEALV
jgi:hypothetical protein